MSLIVQHVEREERGGEEELLRILGTSLGVEWSTGMIWCYQLRCDGAYTKIELEKEITVLFIVIN